MPKKRVDFIVTVIILVVAATFCVIFKIKPLLGGFIYLLVPSLYLMARESKNYKKIFWGVLTIGLFMGLLFDFLETYGGGWSTIDLTIPWRILGVPPIDNIIGYMLMTLFTLVFYEHFLDDEKKKSISKSLPELVILSGGAMVLLLVTYIVSPHSVLVSHYAYLKGGLLAVIFPILFMFRNPRLIPKIATMASFFFFVWLVAELVVVKNSGWIYPGQYIGWVTLFDITFPIEELLFWMLFYAATIVAFYERFIDDDR